MLQNSESGDLEIIDNEQENDEVTPLQYKINIMPADYPLEVLYHKWQRKEIIIPTFQRNYVWTIKQASKLIESFMMGLPIPPVFFHISDDGKNTVIDGRQRLQTAFFFFDGFFKEADHHGKRKEFKLIGIDKKSPWHNKRFEDFTETDQRILKNFVLRAMLIKQVNPEQDHSSIYHIFERLNTEGTPLTDQEIRNCVYHGKLNTLLDDLNKYSLWREILGKPKFDSRQKDIQLILRYMSLFHNSKDYKRPMKEFLSTFMNQYRNPHDDFLQDEANRFKKTCNVIVEHLGKRPFNPKGALNPSIFDSIFIAFAKNFDQIPSNIVKRMNTLKNDEEFKKLTSRATTDYTTVVNRIELAENVLFR